LHDGKVTGRQGGDVLLRGKSMPSRALDLSRSRRIVTDTADTKEGVLIRIDVTQRAGGRKATGKFDIKARVEGETVRVELIELGLLQVTDNWATLSARVRTGSDTGERAMVALFEGADPSQPDRRPSITLVFDGDFSKPVRLPRPPRSIRIQ
jgi:hypothetical protein